MQSDSGHGTSHSRRCTLQLNRRTCLPDKCRKNRKIQLQDQESEVETEYGSYLLVNNGSQPTNMQKFTSQVSELDEADKKKEKYSIASTPFMDVSFVDPDEIENICLAVFRTTLHLSTTSDSHNKYISYMQQVMSIPDDKLNAMCTTAEKRLMTVLQLVCCVRRASQLQSKDSRKSPSDVACHLTVIPQNKQTDAFFQSHNMLEWQEKGLISLVKKTKSVSSSTCPVWNETFTVELNDPAKEMVVIEIWETKDKDPKSTKKYKEYYKKPGNFIGRAFYLLKTTPIQGEERTLTLFSHSGKHQRGQVDLHLSIKGQREDIPVDVSIREYTILLKLIVDHSSQKNGTYIWSWDAKLNREAETVLSKYVELTNISPLQESATRFHVYLEYHKFSTVRLAAIANLVEEITEHKKLSKEDLEHHWAKQLLYGMLELHVQLLEVIRGHLVNLNIKAKKDIDEITSCVRALQALNSFSPLVNKLSKNERDLKTTLEICIQTAVPRWFLELSPSALKGLQSVRVSSTSACIGEIELMTLKGLCNHCLKHAQRAYKFMNPIFKSVGVDYFTAFYVTLDKLLCVEAMPRIQHFPDMNDDQIKYELYVIFRDLAKLSEHVSSSHRKTLELPTFHEYFVGMPLKWIDLASKKSNQRIEKAIGLDERVDIASDEPRFSSSALDTESILLQLGFFWKNLEWPIASDAIGYLITVIERISRLTLFYVDNLYKSLIQEATIMYDEHGRFKSSERLCVILNNMYHIRKTLKEMPVVLELGSYYSWLEEEAKLGEKAKSTVSALLSSNDEDIENKISFFVDRISERLTPDINHFFEMVVHSSRSMTITTSRHFTLSSLKPRTPSSITELQNSIHWPWQNKETDDQLSNEEAVTPLLNYLTTNLQILGDYLLTPVLYGILIKLWNAVMGVVQGKIVAIPRKASAVFLYERLEYFMRQLKTFFHADGNGMTQEDLENEAYKFVRQKLNLLQMPAQDLLERYVYELSEQQKYLENHSTLNQGTLQLSLGYLIDKGIVEVSVVHAKNLVGKSQMNTYVEVYLLPDWLFPQCAKKSNKTPVIKKTNNPFYGEEFRLPAGQDALMNIGAVLLVVVCEDDTNSVLGMSAVQGIEIPQLYEHVDTLSQTNIPERMNSTLTLFLQDKSAVFKEIEARIEVHDHDIVELQRSNKKLFERIQIKRHTIKRL